MRSTKSLPECRSVTRLGAGRAIAVALAAALALAACQTGAGQTGGGQASGAEPTLDASLRLIQMGDASLSCAQLKAEIARVQRREAEERHARRALDPTLGDDVASAGRSDAVDAATTATGLGGFDIFRTLAKAVSGQRGDEERRIRAVTIANENAGNAEQRQYELTTLWNNRSCR